MRPRNLTPAELGAVLRDMASVVEDLDSFEGNIHYEPAEDVDTPAYAVTAFYRVGNSMGQGGCRIIGDIAGGDG